MGRIIVLLLLAAACGCRTMSPMNSPATAVTLPGEAGAITAIEVTPNLGEPRTTAVITDPKQIARFVAFVNSRPSGWGRTWHTFSAGEYTVGVKRNKETVAAFWPSARQLGGVSYLPGSGEKSLRPLSASEWSELASILGLSAEREKPKEERPAARPTAAKR